MSRFGEMNAMNIWSKSVEPAKPAHWAHRDGMLAVVLGLLAWNIHLFLT